MAGLDKMYDAQAFIQEHIEKQIRELLEDPMNELQDPNWVQAALLFEQVVVPCEGHMSDLLYNLAEDIVKKAVQHNNRAIYQVIPGMYNEKVLDEKSIDMNNLPDKTDIRDYEETINNIKNWMDGFKARY